MKTRTRPQRIGIVSLGCAKNLVDSEVLMKQLDSSRFRLVWEPADSSGIDAVIINTCGFILDAKNESLETILRFAGDKQKGRLDRLFVMGCLSQRYRDELAKEIPEVDGLFGVNELEQIVDRVGGTYRNELIGERILTTPGHYAYFRIAEGCNRRCSFCAIPMIRGNHISLPMDELVRQAEKLANQGVRELILISQDTTYYGLDLYGKRKLPELLARLSDVRGLDRIRLHYAYPDDFPTAILDLMRERPNICRYLDIPLQHISGRILRSMRRGISPAGIRDLISTVREKVPGLAIRTTFMTGYPGETDREFGELKEFIVSYRFERLGVFTYSHEEGTHAFGLKDDIGKKVKKQRADELMEVQEEISGEINAAKIGGIYHVIIDRKENGKLIGRTEFDSPEIDNEVIIEDPPEGSETGEIHPVRITDADAYDLYGEIVTR